MTRSMTGYASKTGQGAGWSWAWDLRAVNGRGLDLRLRVPDWVEGLEAATRTAVQGEIARGSVTLSLRATRAAETGVNREDLSAAVALVREAEHAAAAAGLDLSPVRASDLVQMRATGGSAPHPQDAEQLRSLVLADLPAVLSDFDGMRRREGDALADLLRGQLDAIEAAAAQARRDAAERQQDAPDRLRTAVARVLEATDAVDEMRLAQELALIAVKADVTEELDRLEAHIAAARELVAGPGPKGRKLEFLVQEFNREANTLCSKSQSIALTRTGLDLKSVIDQMREQVQNVE